MSQPEEDELAGAEPAGQPGGAASDDEVIEFGHRMLDLARAGDRDLLAYVDAGVPADLTGPDGNTLLMLAAYHGHAALVAGLAELGADPDRCNDRGQSPLAGAVFKLHREVVDALLAAGADPHHGQPSAVQTARFFEQDELAERLEAATPPE